MILVYVLYYSNNQHRLSGPYLSIDDLFFQHLQEELEEAANVREYFFKIFLYLK